MIADKTDALFFDFTVSINVPIEQAHAAINSYGLFGRFTQNNSDKNKRMHKLYNVIVRSLRKNSLKVILNNFISGLLAIINNQR